jgi:membrane-associated phospholipid phosphatase
VNTPKNFFRHLPLVQHLSVQLVVGLMISFACLGAFSAIAEDVVEKDRLVQVDTQLANALHSEATPTSTSIYKIISFIGLPGVWVLGAAMALFFALKKSWFHLAVWMVALVGGMALNDLLKHIFTRPRPSFADPLLVAQNYSFPSGHAMMSLIGYGLFAYFLWHSLMHYRYLRIILTFALALLVVLIGISRMALGVHYLSDVVAGYAAGGVWLTACILAMNTVDRRKVEPSAVVAKTDSPTDTNVDNRTR